MKERVQLMCSMSFGESPTGRETLSFEILNFKNLEKF